MTTIATDVSLPERPIRRWTFEFVDTYDSCRPEPKAVYVATAETTASRWAAEQLCRFLAANAADLPHERLTFWASHPVEDVK